jgi:hypothetical protein
MTPSIQLKKVLVVSLKGLSPRLTDWWKTASFKVTLILINLKTAVRNVGSWCEMAASLRGSEFGSRGMFTFGRHYPAEQ